MEAKLLTTEQFHSRRFRDVFFKQRKQVKTRRISVTSVCSSGLSLSAVRSSLLQTLRQS